MSCADFESVSLDVVLDARELTRTPRLHSVSPPSSFSSLHAAIAQPILLGGVVVPRIWIGLWQLSSPAWGTAPVSKIRAEMNKHFLHGFTTFGLLLLLFFRISVRPPLTFAFTAHTI